VLPDAKGEPPLEEGGGRKESTGMRTQTRVRGPEWGTKAKTLTAGLMVAAMMAAGMVAASQAHASTTFTVNSSADTPDAFTTSNTCDTDVFTGGDQCTLRAAIQQANATPGADTISFAIPGTGVKTIKVGASGLGSLPDITDPVTIDGYTQPGSSPNTKAVGNDAALKIVLDGSSAGSGADGLAIDGASNSVIRGLVINSFGHVGIDVFGDSVGTRIKGNFIGTDPTGTLDKGNGNDGVALFDSPSQTVVGGTTPAARNLISGNEDQGIDLGTSGTPGGLPEEHRIQGNYIGTDRSGTKNLGNRFCGVSLNDTEGNTLGGTTAATRNVLSGNADGACLFRASDTLMLGNRIGTTASGTGALGNDNFGVAIFGSSSFNSLGDGTAAGSNTIAFNAKDGVIVGGDSLGNKFSRNSIFSNGGLGIDLPGPGESVSTDVATPNDPGDADEGPNGLQNTPVITSAKNSSTKTTITGKLASAPETSYTIEFYSNPSGNEGKKFLGSKLVSTDISGNATFTFTPSSKVAAGQTVTATATPVRIEAGGTSEFSAPKKVAS
jgi:CSLREA domain-containing protein